MQHHYKIIKWSVLSRVAVVLLSMLSSSLVPTYDLSFDVQSSPASSSLEPPSTSSIFDSLARWDGVYFIRLAETNLMYEYEQFHAFFPLLPAAIHHCTHFITSLCSYPTTATSSTLGSDPAAIPRAHYIAVGVVLTNLAFVVASLLLYRLGVMVFGPRQRTKAYTSVLLFCVSPASIFFSSVYSKWTPFSCGCRKGRCLTCFLFFRTPAESVFAMFSFGFMVCYLHVVQTIDARRKMTSGPNPPRSIVHLLPWWAGCVACGVLATFTRSNGVVLGAYPLHYAVINVYRELSRHRRKRNISNTKNTRKTTRKNTVNIAVITVMAIAVALCTALPLVYVDRMGRELYCHTNSSGNAGRPWCGTHG